jgi:hypothetical protein
MSPEPQTEYFFLKKTKKNLRRAAEVSGFGRDIGQRLFIDC